jgi:hypothetical protein
MIGIKWRVDRIREALSKSNIKPRFKRARLTWKIPFNTKRLIVFLTPGYEWRVGGIISIASIYRESIALKQIHRARVVLCTVPGDPLLLQYTWFKNSNYMLELESVLQHCQRLDYLLIHIPEYAVNQVLQWLASTPTFKRNIREVQLNVMLQNIDLIQGQDVTGLKRFGSVTCTTAHEAYTNAETRNALGVPLHRLGVFRGPELYCLSGYEKKAPILIVSHDQHPAKDRVLLQISQSLPALRIEVVKDLQFEAYKDLVRHAKWSLTFGEGLDSYFADTVLSGGVAFAVFNERFFTPACSKLGTVYPSWEALLDRIAVDIERLDEPVAYNRCWREMYELLSEIYSTARFRENLRKFYSAQYTFP